jgi:outer membrane protein TolC
LGTNALSIDSLFGPGSGVWSIAGAALAPVFHGGTLFEREIAAREAFDQAASQYRSVVITAFKNVADCLTALQTDAVALQKAVAAETVAAKTLEITRRRLKIGDVNYLELLNAQQTYQRALMTLVFAQSNRFSDTAALFQALGGGWWNRADVEPPRERSFFSFLGGAI